MSCPGKMRTMVSKRPVAILAVVPGAALLGAVSVWLVEQELIAQTGMSLALGAASFMSRSIQGSRPSPIPKPILAEATSSTSFGVGSKLCSV